MHLCICVFVYCAIVHLCICVFVYLCICVYIGGWLSPDKKEYQSAFVYWCDRAFVFVYLCSCVFVFISAAGCLLTRRNIGGVQQGPLATASVKQSSLKRELLTQIKNRYKKVKINCLL